MPAAEESAINRPQAKRGGQQRAEASADLRDGAFAPARAAAADRARGDDFHQRHAWPNVALIAMVSVDDRIGAVPFCFRRETVDQQPAGETAQGRNGEQQPRRNAAAGVGSQARSGSPAGCGSG